ncbi:hypothetical protein U9M48_025265 [Paspalum notatum var. saurae]|uniref:Uncharacterized protein n=1 Tax=Paspalum notatum var. saurae TaxID=547442 RepID=A0AAQ3WXC8_PASNO
MLDDGTRHNKVGLKADVVRRTGGDAAAGAQRRSLHVAECHRPLAAALQLQAASAQGLGA